MDTIEVKCDDRVRVFPTRIVGLSKLILDSGYLEPIFVDADGKNRFDLLRDLHILMEDKYPGLADGVQVIKYLTQTGVLEYHKDTGSYNLFGRGYVWKL